MTITRKRLSEAVSAALLVAAAVAAVRALSQPYPFAREVESDEEDQ